MSITPTPPIPKSGVNNDVQPFSLDRALAIDPSKFPNPPRFGSRQLPTTIPNIQYMLTTYNITIHYDVIRKCLDFNIPGLQICPDNAANTALAEITSLAMLNGFIPGPLKDFVAAIGDRNHVNPIKAWITSKPWDGKDRIRALLDTITVEDGYPPSLRDVLGFRWLLSATAAAIKEDGFKSRGVLTFQGGQGIGKTSWLNSLMPEDMRARFIKIDHHLDASNKD